MCAGMKIVLAFFLLKNLIFFEHRALKLCNLNSLKKIVKYKREAFEINVICHYLKFIKSIDKDDDDRQTDR